MSDFDIMMTAQVVLFLFLSFKTRMITSNPPTSFPPKINNKYAGGRQIGLERINTCGRLCPTPHRTPVRVGIHPSLLLVAQDN
jgi:hypothetical protein